MSQKQPGRHRAPQYNPLNELVLIASRSAQPAVKASAVAVASGGLVASFALPASAAQVGGEAAAASSASAVSATEVLAVAAPAVDPSTAPEKFGVIGFTAQPAPVKAAEPVVAISKVKKDPPPAARASRSEVRAAPAAVAAIETIAADSTAPAPADGIIGVAASLTGIPYRWGGTTPAGFDCSGYTGYVYAKVGKSIPRTAEAQRQASTKVTNPVPGDLVFVGYPAYHVGIYAGDGKLYDSQRPGTTSGLHVLWTSKNVSYGRF